MCLNPTQRKRNLHAPCGHHQLLPNPDHATRTAPTGASRGRNQARPDGQNSRRPVSASNTSAVAPIGHATSGRAVSPAFLIQQALNRALVNSQPPSAGLRKAGAACAPASIRQGSPHSVSVWPAGHPFSGGPSQGGGMPMSAACSYSAAGCVSRSLSPLSRSPSPGSMAAQLLQQQRQAAARSSLSPTGHVAADTNTHFPASAACPSPGATPTRCAAWSGPSEPSRSLSPPSRATSPGSIAAQLLQQRAAAASARAAAVVAVTSVQRGAGTPLANTCAAAKTSATAPATADISNQYQYHHHPSQLQHQISMLQQSQSTARALAARASSHAIHTPMQTVNEWDDEAGAAAYQAAAAAAPPPPRTMPGGARSHPPTAAGGCLQHMPSLQSTLVGGPSPFVSNQRPRSQGRPGSSMADIRQGSSPGRAPARPSTARGSPGTGPKPRPAWGSPPPPTAQTQRQARSPSPGVRAAARAAATSPMPLISRGDAVNPRPSSSATVYMPNGMVLDGATLSMRPSARSPGRGSLTGRLSTRPTGSLSPRPSGAGQEGRWSPARRNQAPDGEAKAPQQGVGREARQLPPSTQRGGWSPARQQPGAPRAASPSGMQARASSVLPQQSPPQRPQRSRNAAPGHGNAGPVPSAASLRQPTSRSARLLQKSQVVSHTPALPQQAASANVASGSSSILARSPRKVGEHAQPASSTRVVQPHATLEPCDSYDATRLPSGLMAGSLARMVAASGQPDCGSGPVQTWMRRSLFSDGSSDDPQDTIGHLLQRPKAQDGVGSAAEIALRPQACDSPKRHRAVQVGGGRPANRPLSAALDASNQSSQWEALSRNSLMLRLPPSCRLLPFPATADALPALRALLGDQGLHNLTQLLPPPRGHPAAGTEQAVTRSSVQGSESAARAVVAASQASTLSGTEPGLIYSPQQRTAQSSSWISPGSKQPAVPGDQPQAPVQGMVLLFDQQLPRSQDAAAQVTTSATLVDEQQPASALATGGSGAVRQSSASSSLARSQVLPLPPRLTLTDNPLAVLPSVPIQVATDLSASDVAGPAVSATRVMTMSSPPPVTTAVGAFSGSWPLPDVSLHPMFDLSDEDDSQQGGDNGVRQPLPSPGEQRAAGTSACLQANKQSRSSSSTDRPMSPLKHMSNGQVPTAAGPKAHTLSACDLSLTALVSSPSHTKGAPSPSPSYTVKYREMLSERAKAIKSASSSVASSPRVPRGPASPKRVPAIGSITTQRPTSHSPTKSMQRTRTGGANTMQPVTSQLLPWLILPAAALLSSGGPGGQAQSGTSTATQPASNPDKVYQRLTMMPANSSAAGVACEAAVTPQLQGGGGDGEGASTQTIEDDVAWVPFLVHSPRPDTRRSLELIERNKSLLGNRSPSFSLASDVAPNPCRGSGSGDPKGTTVTSRKSLEEQVFAALAGDATPAAPAPTPATKRRTSSPGRVAAGLLARAGAGMVVGFLGADMANRAKVLPGGSPRGRCGSKEGDCKRAGHTGGLAGCGSEAGLCGSPCAPCQ